ncbi:MAG: hypothetical protein K2J12_05940 [Muribaculaceae bacterium]|nr:hypothetical protein [Muribaculaceae bacterium]
MKKVLLMAAIAVAGLTACQSPATENATDSTAKCETTTITLKEAFDELSKVQHVAITEPDYNLPVIADVISDAKIAAAYNLDAAGIKASGDQAFKVLDKLPMSKIINGGTNGEVAAFVYAEPNDSGSNDALIAVMSGYRGSVVFMYGTMDDAAKEAIQNAPLSIEGINLNLDTTLPDGNEFRIAINKGR